MFPALVILIHAPIVSTSAPLSCLLIVLSFCPVYVQLLVLDSSQGFRSFLEIIFQEFSRTCSVTIMTNVPQNNANTPTDYTVALHQHDNWSYNLLLSYSQLNFFYKRLKMRSQQMHAHNFLYPFAFAHKTLFLISHHISLHY